MAYKQVLLGDYFKFEKGLGYKGEFLAEDSEVALIGMDSHEEGGGYKEGSEKPYSGPYKEIHVSNPGDVIFAATDLTQDGHVLGSPLLVPDSDEFQTFIYSHHLLKAFQIQEGFLPEYLYNIYRCEKYRLKAAYADSGTTVRALPSDVLEEQIVPLPDLPTQQAINEVISLIDQQIANNISLSKNLELLAQSIFESWFIDFDPVHAKSRGEKPFGMDDETAALFPDSFEESELGMIPKGWSWKTIGDIAYVIDCLHSKKPKLLADGFPYLQLDTISDNGVLNFENAGRVSKEDYEKWTSRIEVMGGDCLITNVGRVGAVSQVPNRFKAAIGRNITAIRPINRELHQSFLIVALLSDFMKEEISRNTDPGTILEALNVKNIPKLVVPGVPDQLVSKFARMIDPIQLMLQELKAMSVCLHKLRDSSLPRLISGELQIPEELLVA